MLPANICRQFFFVITTTANTCWMVENFQLICYSQWVNATSQYNNSGSSRCSKWRNDQTLLAPCARNKRLQRKMTNIYKVTGGWENLWGHPKNICLLGGSKIKNWKTSSALGRIPHKTIEKYLQKTDWKSIKLAIKAFLHEDSWRNLSFVWMKRTERNKNIE